jgi:hypothetical protein
MTHIPQQRILHLRTLLLGVAPLRRRRRVPSAALGSKPDVLVVSYRALREAVQDLLLLVAEPLCPGTHGLEHLALYF